jgi:hypothetical protein
LTDEDETSGEGCGTKQADEKGADTSLHGEGSGPSKRAQLHQPCRAWNCLSQATYARFSTIYATAVEA